MPSFLTRTLVAFAAASGLALGVPAVANAASTDWIVVLGGQMRQELAERGVQRPNLSDHTLGLIASDICTYQNVRSELDIHLMHPTMAIPQFFLAAHSAC